jgi:hypothetical protein
MADQWWIKTRGRTLGQGDILFNCGIPIMLDNPNSSQLKVDVAYTDVIIISQSCDLENKKLNFVAVCPVHNLINRAQQDPAFKKLDILENIRIGRKEGLHLLASPENPENNQEALLVDFREIYSLPFTYLQDFAEAAGDRWRLQPPYLEHLSQAFARFFMRVGLPSSIPPYTKPKK